MLLLLLAVVARAAEPRWITIQNANFHVYSSASERDTRAILAQFERVRAFFAQFTGTAPDQRVPVSVVIFGSEKEYQSYRPNEFAAAYYAGQSDRDFIVVDRTGEQSSQIAAHEYTHLVFRHAGMTLPPWLNEGLADLYSTLRRAGGDTELGDVLPGRLQALARDPWVPMQTILAADHNSPYYNEKQKAGSLYNQSWALVHMLATSDQYRARFSEVIRAINLGTPSVQALETAYAMPFERLESALRAYVVKDQYRLLKSTIKLDETESLPGVPADPFEVREVQAELMMGLQGRQAEARTRFQQLARDDATRPEPWASLGYLALRDGNRGEAATLFGRAFDLGSRSPRLLMDFARLAGRDKPDSSAAALALVLVDEPQNLDARLMLANLQMTRSQYAEALATVRAVKATRSPEERDRLLYLRAFAAMRTGDVMMARASAEELKKVSDSETLRARADEILRSAERR